MSVTRPEVSTVEEVAPPRGVRTAAIVRWGLIAAMGLAALGSILYAAGVFDRGAERATTLYRCPMHPSIVQDHPGECPICGMTLQRVENAPARAVPGPSTPPGPVPPPGLVPIDLTPERIQLIGMRTATVVRRALAPELRTVGYVAPNEDGLAHIHTRFSGWIEELYATQTGQRVGRGDVLATLYSADLLNAQRELLNARSWSLEPPAGPDVGGAGGAPIHAHESGGSASSVTASLAEDARRRLELLGISRPEIDEILRTGQPVRAVKIRSPVGGFVLAKTAVRGLYVDPAQELFQVADLSTVWVLADIYEFDIGRVHVGQRSRVSFSAYPGETFDGTVAFLYPVVDPSSRTMRLRVVVPNRGLRLRPGMFGDVALLLDSAEGLVIPREALVDTGEAQYVFVALAGGRFEPRRVRPGVRSGEEIQILEGVGEGETVVTTANFLLDSESRLRAAIEGATGSTGGAAAGAPAASACDRNFDRQRYPDKYQACRACEIQHGGMGAAMVEDCKNAIPRPWR